MDNFLDQLGGRSSTLFGKVSVNSAANPALWLCAVSVVCFSACAVVSDPLLRWALFGIGVLPVLNAIVTLQRFLWKSPNYLRSEDHQLRQAILERLGDDSYEVSMVEALLSKPPLVKAPPAIEHRPDEQ
ncbi:MAG TPA: hypothetical protein VHW66_00555 [Stellaceae bacterium]|jgi:hypothetical protein|nr:hypothetical protein [Stellaceae bacterium]